jgi:hypothetical protein
MEVSGYRALPESLTDITRIAKSAKLLRSRTPAKLYLYDTLPKRLSQDLEDMPPELRQFIQEENAVVCQRYLARPGEVPAANPPHVRHRLVWRPQWTHNDARSAGAGEHGGVVMMCAGLT